MNLKQQAFGAYLDRACKPVIRLFQAYPKPQCYNAYKPKRGYGTGETVRTPMAETWYSLELYPEKVLHVIVPATKSFRQNQTLGVTCTPLGLKRSADILQRAQSRRNERVLPSGYRLQDTYVNYGRILQQATMISVARYLRKQRGYTTS